MQHHEVRSGVEFSLCFDRLLWFDEFPSASIDFSELFLFLFSFSWTGGCARGNP